MSEAEFTVFENIVIVLELFIYATCFTIFYYPFMVQPQEQKKSRIKKICLVFVIYSAIYLVGSITNVFIYGWLCMMIIIALIVAVSKFLDIDSRFSFLLSVLFFSVRYLSNMMLQSANFLLSLYVVQGKTVLKEILRSTMTNYIIMSIFQILLFSFLLYLVAKCLRNMKWKLHIRELCYLALIPITGILFGNIIVRLLIVIKGNQFFQLYEQYPVFLGIVPLIAVLFYLGIISTVTAYKQMIALQEEKKKYFVEEQQVYAMQERIEEVEQFYKGIRQMKHEMRNHLTNIKGLAESGKYDDMEQYIARMDESMSAYELIVKTGNAVTDVIVNDKKKAADKLGIKFQTEFSYPLSDRYNAYDIGIVLNNLLTNALEACEKINEKEERYIILSGRQKRKFFLIEVKNTFEGEIEFDTNTELPVSTKQIDISLHGMGLSNVKREVEKYMGDMKIKVRKNEFSATVLLQERRTENGYQ